MFRRLITSSLTAILALLLPWAATADEIDLVGPLPEFADVLTKWDLPRDLVVSPDEHWAVFEGDLTTDDAHDLWVVPLDGSSSPRRLHDQALPAGGEFLSLGFVAGDRYVYFGPWNTSADAELWIASLDGSSAPVRIHSELGVDEFFVDGGTISDDGTRIAYAISVSSARDEIWVAPLDGSGASLQVATVEYSSFEQLATGYYRPRPVLSFVDGDSRVVYGVEDHDDVPPGSEQPVRAFSVPSDGSGAPVELTGVWPEGAEGVTILQVQPDGDHVVFAADQATDGVYETWTVPADGSTGPIRLHEPLSGGFDSLHEVVFVGDRALTLVFDRDTFSSYQLWTGRLDGTVPPAQLDIGGIDAVSYDTLTITPDGSRVLFLQKPTALAAWELFSAPVDGSATATRLSAPGIEVHERFQTTDDGSRVVFRMQDPSRGSTTHWELYSAPVTGGSRVPVGPVLDGAATCGTPSESGVCSFGVGGSDVLLDATSSSGSAGLWTAPASGSAASFVDQRRLHPWFRFPWAGPARALLVDLESSFFFYRASYDGSLAPAPVAELVAYNPFYLWPLGDGSRVLYVGRPDPGSLRRSLYIADDGRHRIFAPFAAPTAQEGDVLEIPVRLTQASVLPVEVQVGIDRDSTADSGDDYAFEPTTITFAPGETEKTLVVRTLTDAVTEVPETLELNLVNDDGVPVDDPRIVVTIEDPAGPKVEFREPARTVEEGSSLGLALQVTDGLNEAIFLVLDRDPRDPGTAQSDDFTTDPTLPATVEIPAGAVSGSLLFEALSDVRDEGDETVRLRIVSADGASVGTFDEAVVTIRDAEPIDQDPIFDDGFESGNTSEWSAVR